MSELVVARKDGKRIGILPNLLTAMRRSIGYPVGTELVSATGTVVAVRMPDDWLPMAPETGDAGRCTGTLVPLNWREA
jgi:DUF917 family protein